MELLMTIMEKLLALIAMINLSACFANLPSDVSKIKPGSAKTETAANKPAGRDPTKPLKSPHGYIITKDYELGRFGGFTGDCTDDKNWPYYWQCMSENSGNGGFK
jgi:hypothetical protein